VRTAERIYNTRCHLRSGHFAIPLAFRINRAINRAGKNAPLLKYRERIRSRTGRQQRIAAARNADTQMKRIPEWPAFSAASPNDALSGLPDQIRELRILLRASCGCCVIDTRCNLPQDTSEDPDGWDSRPSMAFAMIF